MHGTRLHTLGAGFAILLVAMALIGTELVRPVPLATAVQAFSASTGPPPAALPWPAQGQAAIGVQGMGVVAGTPTPRPMPMASIAKVMTALLTLQAKPLAPGQQGPDIAVTDADQQAYEAAANNGESVVPVQSGQTLSEYQALQGLLVAAGDNVASLLSRWVAGSEAAFVAQMNSRAVQLGLHQTSFADSSGLSPANVSIPGDLVLLGQAAMAVPALAEIVGQPQVTVPLMGVVPNFNTALGQSGIVGIKTGILPPAGADFLFAGQEATATGPTLVVGAVQGIPSQDETFASAKALLEAVRSNVRSAAIVTSGQRVGRYETQWNASADLVATRSLTVPVWPGATVRARLAVAQHGAPVQARAPVGNLEVEVNGTVQKVPVATAGTLGGPAVGWRLLRGP